MEEVVKILMTYLEDIRNQISDIRKDIYALESRIYRIEWHLKRSPDSWESAAFPKEEKE